MHPSLLASIRLGFAVCLIGLVAACATSVNHAPANFSALSVSTQRQIVSVEKSVELTLGTGYSRSIKGGSKWELIGTLAQGDVFKPQDSIFTVEGANVHEAYLVISNKTLVGFYLPVERGFVARTEKPQITFTTTSK